MSCIYFQELKTFVFLCFLLSIFSFIYFGKMLYSVWFLFFEVHWHLCSLIYDQLMCVIGIWRAYVFPLGSKVKHRHSYTCIHAYIQCFLLHHNGHASVCLISFSLPPAGPAGAPMLLSCCWPPDSLSDHLGRLQRLTGNCCCCREALLAAGTWIVWAVQNKNGVMWRDSRNVS